MGIYDREYYRSDGPGFLGSFTERGYICKWLIGINIVAFILQVLTKPAMAGHELAPGWFTETFELSIPKLLEGQVWRLLSYSFLHDPSGLLHIIFNLLFLWWFGSDVEEIYGRKEFLAFYLVSAALGAGGYVLTGLAQITNPAVPCIGASGAVTAVMVLCALHFPNRIILLFFVLPVPIWLLVVFQIAQDLLGLLGRSQSGTAFSVHLAGAAFAFVYYKSQVRFLDWFGRLQGWRRQHARPRLRLYYEEERRTPVHAMSYHPELDEQLEAKMDAVLQKVQDHGIDSLTSTERQILLRASEAYKRRRR